jgi:MFS family permease
MDIPVSPTPAAATGERVEPADRLAPGTSPKYAPGRANRRYLTLLPLTHMSIAAVWGACGILIANQVQMLETAQWFTGRDAGVNLQALNLLQQKLAAGTITASAEQQRLLGILNQFNSAKASSLAIVTAIAVAVTMLAQPLIGIVSDRTRSRFGRRAPWILFGALTGGGLLALLPFAPNIALVGVLWTVAQVLINVAQAPVNATIADRIAPERRGLASALGGFGAFLGLIAGVIFAGNMFATLGLGIYAIVAAFLAAICVVFVVVAPDASSERLEVPVFDWKEFLIGFTVALRSANYRWVWVARVLLTFGITVSTALGIYMMQSYIHPALSIAEATAMSPMLYLAAAPFTILATVVAGWFSDRSGRRKPFVIAASLIMATALLVPVASPTLAGLFLQAILVGLAYGIYLPVDNALFIDVLPDAKSAGRDLGVAAFGNNLGQALGPIAAGIVVSLTGGYLGVWLVGCLLVAFAAVAIVPVRGIR